LSQSREGKQHAGEQDRREEFVRHESPFEYVHDCKPESVSALAHPSCRIPAFRRDRVSKVCHCGGVLLAFATSQKMPQRLIAGNFEIVARM